MLSSCDRATRLLSVMVKVTESTLSAESGCKRRLLKIYKLLIESIRFRSGTSKKKFSAKSH